MYFSEEERKIQLTQKIINNDICDVPWYIICGGIGCLALAIPCTILFIVNFIERAFLYKMFDFETVGSLLMAVALLFVDICLVYYIVSAVKRFLMAKKGAYLVVEDQIDYLTLEEEVRYEGSRRHRRRVYVLVDILHFKQYGEYRIDNPCGHAGGARFYLVISEDGGKIYNMYSLKTYYYRK